MGAFGKVHSTAFEFDTLQGEPGALVKRRFERSFDLAAGPQHAMPWETVVAEAVQNLGDLAMIAWEAGGQRHFGIGGYFTARNAENGGADSRDPSWQCADGGHLRIRPWRPYVHRRRAGRFL